VIFFNTWSSKDLPIYALPSSCNTSLDNFCKVALLEFSTTSSVVSLKKSWRF
jgi:hypothetical protein